MKASLVPLLFILFAIAACAPTRQSQHSQHPQQVKLAHFPSLIPWPASLIYDAGHFTVSSNTPICVGKNAEAVAEKLRVLVKQWQDINLSSRSCDKKNISLSLDAKLSNKGPESYVINIGEKGIELIAPQVAGLYYAAVTLAQLISSSTPLNHLNQGVKLQSQHIEDAPRYPWRGLMLDPARHFLPLAEVKKIIQQMAQLKLNRLHLHLSDDQGWRVEIKKYPRLTSVGAWRTPPSSNKKPKPPLKPYGGFYSQQDIREIVTYASAHYISVIPEIDMPGHAQAAVAAYPEIIGVTGDKPEVSHDWGINPYLFSTRDTSMQFIKDVLDEIIALFPAEYIHLGGDEAIKDQWQASPEIQQQMRRLGVSDAHKMQGWFMAQLGDYLSQHGKKMIGWDEILEGGVPESATVMSWRGNAGTVAAVRLGHDVVQSSFYLDNLQSTRGDEPAGRLGFLPLARIYKTDIMPVGLSPEESQHVLGAQGHLWSEFLNSPWYVQRAAFPRAAAIAEILWSQSSALSWSNFLQRLPDQMQRFKAQNISAADAAFAVNFGLQAGRNQAIKEGTAKLVLSNQVEFGNIHYSLDGSEPNIDSAMYKTPLEIKLGTTVKALTLDKRGRTIGEMRTYHFSKKTLRTRGSSQFHTCYGGGFGLRLPLTADSPAKAPVYNADIFHNCFIYPKAALEGISAAQINIAKIARNYGLAHEAHKVKRYKNKTLFGELVLYLDTCDSGRELSRIPLEDPELSETQQTLLAKLPPLEGVHNLCFVFSSPLSGPFYGVDSIELRSQL